MRVSNRKFKELEKRMLIRNERTIKSISEGTANAISSEQNRKQRLQTGKSDSCPGTGGGEIKYAAINAESKRGSGSN